MSSSEPPPPRALQAVRDSSSPLLGLNQEPLGRQAYIEGELEAMGQVCARGALRE